MLANSAPSIGLPGVWYLTRLSGFLVQSPVDNFSLTSPFYSSVTQHLVTFNKILFTKGSTQVQSAPYCRPGPPLEELHCSPDLLVDWGGYIGWSPFPLNTFGVLMSSLVFLWSPSNPNPELLWRCWLAVTWEICSNYLWSNLENLHKKAR